MQFETNYNAFNTDLKKFAKLVDEDFEKVFRKVVFLIFRNVVFLTPVDTGRARSNWQVGVNEVNLETNAVGEGAKLTEGAAASTAISSANKNAGKGKIKAGDVVYITNNVPYIEILEDGTDGRKAYNMVKGAIAIVGKGIQGALG